MKYNLGMFYNNGFGTKQDNKTAFRYFSEAAQAGNQILALQSQLEGTENRIAIARRDYIEAVRAYNTELRTWPGIIWASTFYRSHKPMETFAATAGSDKPPSVKF